MILESPSLLITLPPLLIIAVLSARMSPAKGYRFGSYIVAILRALVLSSIVVGLARPHSVEEKPADNLPILVDISASISESQGDALLRRANAIAAELQIPVRVIPFARTVSSQAHAGPTTSFAQLRLENEQLDPGGTHLENALRYLNSSALQGPAKVPALLLSDGYETDGSYTEALNLGVSSRIFPLTENGESSTGEIEIAQLYAPLLAKAQRSVDIRATIANHRPSAAKAHLSIRHGEKEIGAKSLSLLSLSEQTISFPSEASLEGLNRVTATLTWSDAAGDHSTSRTTWLSGDKREKVLLISGSDDDARYLADILQSQSYQLHSIIGGRDGTVDNRKLADFSAIILNNIARKELPPGLIDALPSYTKQGGGLVMIGGPESFGLGGYINSPLEGILPVKLLPPRTEKKRLNIAIDLIIDQSQSMDNSQKLEFAKLAANRVVESLKDDDLVGVVGFSKDVFRVIPLAPVALIRQVTMERIKMLHPMGRTNLLPALEEAETALTKVLAGRKHAIVITDGKLPDALENGEIYTQLVRRMNVMGITVSTVLVGAEDDTGLLKHLAIIGGGSHYRTMNAADIPSIFLSDISVASGERSLRESTDIQVYKGPQEITSTSLTAFPPLKGFVETKPRDDATTELIVSDRESTYPLLASRKSGRGNVIAFTSDANGRWSAPWMRWPHIHQFWSDIIDSARPPVSEKPKQHQFDVRHWVEGGELGMELVLFDDPGPLPITARITTPIGEQVSIPLSLQSIGRYRGSLLRPSAGTYRAIFSVGKDPLPEVAWYVSGEMFGEAHHPKPQMTILSQIANRTGGSVNPPTEILRRALTLKQETRDYSLLLFACALMLFALEVAVRELLRVGRT